MSDDTTKNVTDSQAPQPAEPHNPLEAIKENLTNNADDKATDDEMARPKEDRSPLT